MRSSLLSVALALVIITGACGCTLTLEVTKEDLKEVFEEIEEDKEPGWFDWLLGE